MLLTGDQPKALQEAVETSRTPPSFPAHSVALSRVGGSGQQADFGELARRGRQVGEEGAGPLLRG